MSAVTAANPFALFDVLPDATLLVDDGFRVRRANPAAARLFGLAPEEFQDRPLDLFLPGATFELRPARVEDAATELVAPRTLDLLARRRQDGQRLVRARVTSVDLDGAALLLSLLEREDEGHDMGATTQWLASIVGSSQDAIVGKTPDGIVTSWNSRAEDLYGYRAEEVVGHNIGEWLAPEQRRQEREIVACILAGERVEPYETQRTHRDGTVIDVSISMSAIVGADGTVIGVSTSARDISERKRAEDQFSSLLESAPDAVLGVQSDGRISLVNEAAERLFGYPRDELLGGRIEQLVPENFRDVHVAHRSSYAREPIPRPMGMGRALAGRRRDGTEFPAEISLSSLATEHGLTVIASVRDVSERLEALAEQERLRTAAQAERLQRQLDQSKRLESLGQLAGGVAHDFNNLLSAILNYAMFVHDAVLVAETDHPDEDWATVRSDVEQIDRAARRATELTRQLLAFGRREIAQPENVDLNRAVQDVEPMLQRTLGDHVKLETVLSAAAPHAWVDPGQLEQVMVNLAINARDALEGGGSITISTELVPAAAEDTALAWARLVVADTGAGMSPEVRQKAFDPFFTTKAQGAGTGLGLSTVYGIVQEADGRIEIESELGVGTRVLVALPSRDGPVEQPAAPPPTSQVPQPRPAKVLLVEDETAIRALIKRLLRNAGYAVVAAESGTDAIGVVAREEFDLLVTDVNMPDMGGGEVAARARELRPELHVLFISGLVQPELLAETAGDDRVGFLQKPFTGPGLLAAVSDLLPADEPADAPAGAPGTAATGHP